MTRRRSRSTDIMARRTTRTPTLRPALHLRRAARPVAEHLERRALPSATIVTPDLAAEADTHTITVTYTDPDGVDVSSIDATDLTIVGPQTPNVTLGGTSGTGTSVTATYTLAGPGGGWDSADNGSYDVIVDA